MEILNEIIHNCQCYLLFEKAIATTVKTISDEVITNINYQINNTQRQLYNKNISEIEYCTNKLIKNIKNTQLVIEWEYFNFTNTITYNSYFKSILQKHRSYIKQNYIKLVFIALNNVIKSKKIENKVYHEVTHWFQEYMKGKPLNKPKPIQYNNAVKHCYNENDYIATASKIIWLYHKFEEDAECHSLYGALMNASDIEDMKKIYANSQQRYELNNIKTFVNNLDNKYKQMDDYDKKIQDSITVVYLNATLKGIISKAKKLIKRLERNYGRTWLQAQYDFRQKHNIHEIVEPDYCITDDIKEQQFHYNLDKISKEDYTKLKIEEISEKLRGFKIPLIFF